MPDKLADFEARIEEDCGSSSIEIRVWRDILGTPALRNSTMMTLGMLLSRFPRATEQECIQIARTLLYLSSPRIRALDYTIAILLDEGEDTERLEPVDSDDAHRYLESHSTIGLTNPASGLRFDEEYPVLSYFCPSARLRHAILEAGE